MTTASQPTAPVIGVIVVTFNAEDVILDCLESLMAVTDTPLKVIVVENASQDNTTLAILDWASGQQPYVAPEDLPIPLPACIKPVALTELSAVPAGPSSLAPVTLIHSGANTGFAGGVNLGLAVAATDPDIQHFWVLNPDSITTPQTPGLYATCAAANPDYGLMGGRTCYMDPPDQIQIDGGTVNLWTGVTGNLNLGASHKTTPPPISSQMVFVTGANLLVSRKFYETVGPMREDYFLYYEEVDWAFRRGDFGLLYCNDTLIYHRAGTAIGSPTLARIASPFSLYFKYRSRMLFIRRFHPVALPLTYLYAMAKAAQIFLKGARREAWALVCALHGLNPPKEVRERLSPEAARIAFKKPKP